MAFYSEFVGFIALRVLVSGPSMLCSRAFSHLSFSHSPTAKFLFVSTCLAPAFSSSSFFSACSTESVLFIHPISIFSLPFALYIYHCAFKCTHTHICRVTPTNLYTCENHRVNSRWPSFLCIHFGLLTFPKESQVYNLPYFINHNCHYVFVPFGDFESKPHRWNPQERCGQWLFFLVFPTKSISY